jgi:hypothetical protein
MYTKEEILKKNGIDDDTEFYSKILKAMNDYSDQNCDIISNLYINPLEKLNSLKDLYRKENPSPDGKFFIPDATKFYEWITNKILNNEIKKLPKTKWKFKLFSFISIVGLTSIINFLFLGIISQIQLTILNLFIITVLSYYLVKN